MSPQEICTKLSLWIVNFYLKSDIFCFHFTLYWHVWIRIPNPDPDPESSWIQIRIHNTGCHIKLSLSFSPGPGNGLVWKKVQQKKKLFYSEWISYLARRRMALRGTEAAGHSPATRRQTVAAAA